MVSSETWRLGRGAPPNEVVVDLSGQSFSQPLGLVGIAAEVDHARRAGRDVRLVPPADRSVGRFLTSMGLPNLLENWGIHHDLPALRGWRPGVILELTRFVGVEQLQLLAQQAAEAAGPLSGDATDALFKGVTELGCNVTSHSTLQHGFVAAQRNSWTGEVAFAVSDTGVGLRRRLLPLGATTDAEALRLALCAGATTMAGSSGTGLSDLSTRLSLMSGSLYLVSGSASVTTRLDVVRLRQGRAAFPGTAVQGTFRQPLG